MVSQSSITLRLIWLDVIPPIFASSFFVAPELLFSGFQEASGSW